MLADPLRPQGNPRFDRRTRRSHNTNRLSINGFWGHDLTTSTNGFRIGFQNINGLPVEATHAQHQHLITTLTTHAFDIFGAQEINLNLNSIDPQNQWWRRFKDKSYFSFPAYNKHTHSKERRLFGGTATFVAQHATSRLSDHGQDPSGLGRWTWVKLTGRQGIATRIINGYRPVQDHSNRPGTVFSQQEKFFYDRGQPRNPRTAFLIDLANEIQQWMDQGDQIILGIDMNEYIFGENIKTWTASMGLISPLQRTHPHLPEVDTCDKSNRGRPIDGIWTTPGIDVLQCGMTGFGEVHIGSSDHRLLWLDVNFDSLFGFHKTEITRRPKNFFPIHDPAAVARYNTYLHRQRQQQGIPAQLATLQCKAQRRQFGPNEIRQYNTLCTLDDSIRKRARRYSRRFYAGHVLYSDVIGNDYKELRLWHLVIKRRSGHRTDTRQIRRLMQKTHQMQALQLSLDEAKMEKQRCYRRYLKHKKDQWALREAFERKQDERIAKAKGTSISTQQQLRRHTRQVRSQFSNVRQIVGSKSKTALYSVEYQDQHGQTLECFTRRDIELACANEGQRRFTQAQFTPFLQGSLLRDLGFLANQEATDHILNGTYVCDNDVEPYTRMFIQELQIQHNTLDLPVITGLTSTDHHISGWKRMNASTSSSPFGPLFSDYIAGTNKPEVAVIDNMLASIPLQAGFCPASWTRAVDVMIPKKTQSSSVEKLRIIVLFHALFNMINKRVGRLMVQRAIATNQIPLEAFGSVPGRRANDCALNKALANDILRQQRRPAALCSNDATSCYDRIVHVVASLCMQRLGVDANTCKVMFATLQHLQHYVATAYGNSETPYGGIQIPLQGVGQGNGAGPAIWLVMTIPLINMLRNRGFGFRSISPISHHLCHMACFTFVDDTDTIHAPLRAGITAAEVLCEMQEVINTWEGGLKATGGTLSPSKSYWYLIDFKWHPQTLQWQYKSIHESPGDLYLSHSDGTRTRLQRHESSHAVETLGVPLAMDGNQKMIYSSLREKIEKWAGKINTRQLNISETVLSLQFGISKTLEYPLTATRLNKTQCNQLMQPLRKAALRALNVPTTFPSLLAHAPKSYLGLGIPNLWFEQGLTQVECLLRHIYNREDNSTAQLYLHVIENLHVELGLPGSPFVHDFYLHSPSTTETQAHTVWQFCWDNGLQMKFDLPTDEPPRQHDQYLMAYFATTGYSAKELRLLNLCRMFLRVKYVSDFCSGDGITLDTTLLERKDPFPHHHALHWPTSGHPNNHCWALWRSALSSLAHVRRNQHHVLHQPLGKWLRIPDGWASFVTTDGRHLYHRLDATTYQKATVAPTRHHTRSLTFLQHDGHYPLPDGVAPTTINKRGRTWTHTGFAEHNPRPPTTPSRWWGTIVHQPNYMQPIFDGIAAGTAVIVTDGSFKQGLGTAAYTLRASIQDLEGLDLVNMTPGEPSDVDPYRAELAGIFGAIRLLQELSQAFTITHGTITIACDCLSAIQRVTQPNHPPPRTPHFDLIMAIRSSLQLSPFTWLFKHVKGHQDQHTHYNQLDRFAQLNVDMDTLAKTYWSVLNAARPPSFGLPDSLNGCSLWCGTRRLTSWDRLTAQVYFFNPALKEYWQAKSTTPLDDIAWEATGRALRRMTLYQQIWIPRWITSFLPTGNRMILFDPQNTQDCPRCAAPETHRFHAIRCQQPSAALLWTQNNDKFASWLQTQHTKPSLRTCLLSILNAWYRETPWQPPPTNDPSDRMVFDAQLRAGTHRVFDGFLVCQWAEAQQQYFTWIKRRNTGQRWLASVIQKIWEIAWDMWRHRHKILHTPDATFLRHMHSTIDDTITELFQQFSNPPVPLPLTRWFSRSLPHLLAETLDFKQQWVAMVQTIIQHTTGAPHAT